VGAEIGQAVDVLRQPQDVDGAEIGRAGAGDDGVEEVGVDVVVAEGLDVDQDVGVLGVEGPDLGFDAV
jgi:hypothetical protein